jgi:hypothetical protein
LALDTNNKRVFFSNLHEFDKKRFSHQELPTTFEVENVQVWKWHHIVTYRLHFLPRAQGMNDGTMHKVSFANAQGDMWWQIGIETKTMPTKLGVNSKHLSWNTTKSYSLDT